MRLYLVRHAEAAPEAAQDSERALTDLGLEQAQTVADWLCQQVAAPVQIFHSPYLRARQTAEVLQQALAVPVLTPVDDLAPEGDLLRAEQSISLALQAGVQELVVVSHMPLLATLESWLVDGVLGTGEPFSLAEVRISVGDMLAPGLLSREGDAFVPPTNSTALKDLRALFSKPGSGGDSAG